LIHSVAEAKRQSKISDETAGGYGATHQSKTRERHIRKGEPLWSQGDDPNLIWTIQRGHATIKIADSNGNQSIIQVCSQGHSLCLAASILGRPLPCSAIAASDVVASATPRSVFLKDYEKQSPAMREMIHQMASNFCQSHVDRLLTTVKQRMARLLDRLHVQFRGARVPFGRQELAEMVGIRSETVSRTLVPWESVGMITSKTNQVQIVLPEKLKKIHT
jgi:CRP-like cAMP-binding protein